MKAANAARKVLDTIATMPGGKDAAPILDLLRYFIGEMEREQEDTLMKLTKAPDPAAPAASKDLCGCGHLRTEHVAGLQECLHWELNFRDGGIDRCACKQAVRP